MDLPGYDEWKLASPPEYEREREYEREAEPEEECRGCRMGLPVEQTLIGPRHVRWMIPGVAQESFDCTAGDSR